MYDFGEEEKDTTSIFILDWYQSLISPICKNGHKKGLQVIEEHNLALCMENIELRRMLEMTEEEKRNMCLELQHVLEEQVDESSTPVPIREANMWSWFKQ